MNLYIRFLILIIRQFFTRVNKAILEPTELNLRVWPNDIDFNLHMNNGRYLTIMDLGRFDFLAKKGLLKPVFKKKWQPVLNAAKIHFIKPLKPFARYQLKTEIIYWDNKWIYLNQSFIQNGNLMAVATVKAIFIHRGQKIAPNNIFDLLGIKEINSPQCPLELENWIKSENLSREKRNG